MRRRHLIGQLSDAKIIHILLRARELWVAAKATARKTRHRHGTLTDKGVLQVIAPSVKQGVTRVWFGCYPRVLPCRLKLGE